MIYAIKKTAAVLSKNYAPLRPVVSLLSLLHSAGVSAEIWDLQLLFISWRAKRSRYRAPH